LHDARRLETSPRDGRGDERSTMCTGMRQRTRPFGQQEPIAKARAATRLKNAPETGGTDWHAFRNSIGWRVRGSFRMPRRKPCRKEARFG
jgi:hypothetical protein